MAEALILRVAKLVDDFVKDGKLSDVGSEFSELKKTFVKDGKLSDVGSEFSELKKTVSFLQSIVPDAEKRIIKRSREIEPWLEDLKDAFYDAEDLLEEWKLEGMQLRESPSKDEKLKQVIPSSSSPSKKPDLRLEMSASARARPSARWLARAIASPSARPKEIGKRLESLAAEGRRLGLREWAEVGRVERRERLDSLVYDEEIIGREDAKSAIMNFLLDSDTNEPISVLSIWGKSGVGKTALARCLYEDDMVKNHFNLRNWVCVGYKDFHYVQSELRKIRERETTERVGDMEQKIRERDTTERVGDMEQLQKYFLVIDDLEYVRPRQWGSLKNILMGGALGSKILITTDNRSVAHFTSTSPYYRLEALRTELSVDLLMKMACQEEEETGNPIKVDIGRRIVKMCDGIPLAIRMIGSLLFSKKTEAEWSNFQDEILEFSGNFPKLSSILELSYIHLPCHLKQCFAFCSLFPRDWVIDKQLLMSLWIAEGFIQPIDNGDWDMEDIAHDYFMDLLRRNFFQDLVKDELGNVTSCRMHHSVHELASCVAVTEYQRISQSLLEIRKRTRHVSWESTFYLSLLPIHGEYCLRTIIKTSQRKSLKHETQMGEYLKHETQMGEYLKHETQMGEYILHTLISSFKLLRALDLHDSSIKKLPSSICELKHLTFLDLSENEGIVRLPDFMTKLKTLQVLKLNMCYKLIELPRDIRKLVNLRQLEISNCNALSYMPRGMGELTLLRTLTDFILPGDDSCPESYGGLRQLNRLKNLRGRLRIEVKGEIKDVVAESNAANLKEKNSLVSLVLVFAGKGSDEILLQELQPSLNLRSLEIRGYGGARFPSWMSCMPKLVQLHLFDCAGCKSLPSLGELTSLKHLEIGELPIAEYTESDIHTLSSLPNLSILRIWECPNLERILPLVHLKELKPPRFPWEPLQTLVATTELVIGIDDRVKDVIKLLEIEDDEVEARIVGIHGTDGIGKTTIAKAVYDRLSSCFDSCSFLAGIGETTQNVGGIQFVQTKLISDVLEQDGDVASFEGGIKFFRDVFRTIKVLIVLDDVEEQSHIDDLVGDQLDWFGPGSRIIVTLENGGILQTYVSRGLARMYEVNEMDNDRAFELFCKHALGTNCPIPGYLEIGKHIVKATEQVPLVIEVIGSFLCGKTIEDWRKIEDLIKLQKENSQEILKDCREILKFCYEALDEKQKQIFWDIAWFANGVDSRIASYMWPNQDPFPSHHVLMPLAKIGGDNMLQMHKLLKGLSITIDQEEPNYPGRRRTQYIHVTDLEVINRKAGTEEVEALCFDFKNLHLCTFTETDFKSMLNIRFLNLDHASMTGNFANVFPKLRWLRWQGCPRDFEAAEFSLTDLVILDLSWSKVTEDWGGWRKIKVVSYLLL
ncbi:hypothetical protein ACJRO7_021293 [Eucalyptus globulus]|uniref:Uncharacterized protein n=1 Tax=Eucalyptus globulus TaxID=34317 RepID=A0ABD3KQH9_EUCGL